MVPRPACMPCAAVTRIVYRTRTLRGARRRRRVARVRVQWAAPV